MRYSRRELHFQRRCRCPARVPACNRLTSVNAQACAHNPHTQVQDGRPETGDALQDHNQAGVEQASTKAGMQACRQASPALFCWNCAPEHMRLARLGLEYSPGQSHPASCPASTQQCMREWPSAERGCTMARPADTALHSASSIGISQKTPPGGGTRVVCSKEWYAQQDSSPGVLAAVAAAVLHI